MNKVEFAISLKGAYRPDEVAGGFVSYCPAFKIYSHGQTCEAAMENLKKTLNLYFSKCLENGSLPKVMEKAGFVPCGDDEMQAYPIADIQHDVEQEFIAIREMNFEKAFDVETSIPYITKAKAVARHEGHCS